MSQLAPPPAPSERSPAASRPTRRRRPRNLQGGASILSQGEPMVWLSGGGLLLCVGMIISLLALVFWQGTATFWPGPILLVTTVDDEVIMGEIAREEKYSLDFARVAQLEGEAKVAAAKLVDPQLRRDLQKQVSAGNLLAKLDSLADSIESSLLARIEESPQFEKGVAKDRNALLAQVRQAFEKGKKTFAKRLAGRIESAVVDTSGEKVSELWAEYRAASEAWFALEDVPQLQSQFSDDENLPYQLWASQAFALVASDVAVPMRRRMIRTGNYELSGEHFRWVSDFEVKEETRPEWAVLLERLTWGRFYGTPTAFKIDDETVATEPAKVWEKFNALHHQVRARWAEARHLEKHDLGRISAETTEALHARNAAERRYGKNSAQWKKADDRYQKIKVEADENFAAIRRKVDKLEAENARYGMIVTTAQGVEQPIPVSEIVRAYAANRLSFWGKLGVYLSRWREFLLDDPRQANSEGGVFPAIWGTVAMTMMLSVVVVPLGVLAALYLREYAKPGPIVSAVRIAVNNLAGVPSIVFGVFGLGFFCYLMGGTIDQIFFYDKPAGEPTFGTGGIMWASLTLALMTLPVVIVATEEALAAVPRSMREGSLACGATKWQTIRRIVLPRAMPGIMTGMILAMARGAGEVAPLMLVGAMKVAPSLPIDSTFPFIHLQRSFMHLGFHIFDLGFQSQNSEAAKPMVFTTTLLLIGVIALMNLLAIWLRARLRRKFQYQQF